MRMDIKRRFQRMGVWIREGSRPKPLLSHRECEGHTVTCLNCGHTFKGNYCPMCGQEASTGRLKMKQIVLDFLSDIGNLDNRLTRTLVELLLRPGYMAHNYIIDGRRKGYYKPVALLFLITAVYMVAQHLMFGPMGDWKYDEEALEMHDMAWLGTLLGWMQTVFVWFRDNRAWLALLVVAGWLYPMKWCFKGTELGRDMSMADFFCLLVLMQCQLLFVSLLLLPVGLVHGAPVGNGFLMELCLSVWLLTQFFGIGWRRCLKRYLASMVIFWGAVSVVVAGALLVVMGM